MRVEAVALPTGLALQSRSWRAGPGAKLVEPLESLRKGFVGRLSIESRLICSDYESSASGYHLDGLFGQW